MLHTILIPLDGSALAERALAYATALSVPTAARLVLLRVVIAPSSAEMRFDEAQARALGGAERYLADVASDLRRRGFRVEPAARRASKPAAAIGSEASECAADLIVMTSHGRTGPGRWIFGSVAESVVAGSRVPVLVERATQPIQRELLLSDAPLLLVPLDGSGHAEAALQTAVKLAGDLGGELMLLGVETPNDVLDAEADVAVYFNRLEPPERVEAAEYLARTAERVARQAPQIAVHTQVRWGYPAEEIVAAATETGAALVVMATHGRTGLNRAVVGSVAGRVLEHGSTPLVLVRPPLPATSQ
jgi:nucleotide-binding universal stress UspA family protein